MSSLKERGKNQLGGVLWVLLQPLGPVTASVTSILWVRFRQPLWSVRPTHKLSFITLPLSSVEEIASSLHFIPVWFSSVSKSLESTDTLESKVGAAYLMNGRNTNSSFV